MKMIKSLFGVTAVLFLAIGLAGCNPSVSGGGNTQTGGNTENDKEEEVIFSSSSKFTPGTTSLTQAANMGIGWNLGNTLDAGKEGTKENKGLSTETSWSMPKTTENMIKAVHAAGFKTIRIPVSWHNHITDGTNYTIDPAWMNRVKTIVDWAIKDNMCVILNIHHDNMSISHMSDTYGFALSDDADITAESKKYLEKVWTQIATTFASYDNCLVFEVLNEPRDIEGEWKGNEWWCGTKAVMDCITAYEKVCIEAIRGVPGNEDRFLMFPGYAASGSDSGMLSLYTMPADASNATADRLILSTHAYSPYAFAMYSKDDPNHKTLTETDKASLDSIFNNLNKNYIKKGIGVVMGEASATDKNNLDERLKWVSYYFTKAREIGIPVVLWDNMVTLSNGGSLTSGECHGWFNRNKLEWYFPSVIEAMMEAAAINVEPSSPDSGNPTDPDPENPEVPEGNSEIVLFSGSLDLIDTKWGLSESIAANKFSSAVSDSKIVFTTEACSDTSANYINIKLQDGDWNTVFKDGTPEGASLGGTDNDVLIPASKTAGFSYKPSSSEWEIIKSKGMVVYGYGIKITKIVLQ